MNRIALLKNFYSSVCNDILKLETREYGFGLLDTILKTGIILDYGEMKKNIPKYKLSNISSYMIDFFLSEHINKNVNVCLYFNERENNVFAFNLDNNSIETSCEISIELKTAVVIMQQILNELGIEPLVNVSGRGYHIWIRINENIDNKIIRDFIKEVWLLVYIYFKKNSLNNQEIIIHGYPLKNTNANSLRLFGSEHIRTKEFSYIVTEDRGVLDEYDSWLYFKDYLVNKTITIEQFETAYEKLMNFGRLERKAV